MPRNFGEAKTVFDRVIHHIKAGDSACAAGVWGNSAELLLTLTAERFPDRPLLYLHPSLDSAEKATEDIPFFADFPILTFPGFDAPPTHVEAASLDILGSRVDTITACMKGKFPLIVSTVQSAQQPVPDRQMLESSFIKVCEGDYLPPEELIRKLIAAGFKRERMVERIGEFAVRGGIIDVFSLLADHPIRIEFFGDDIESVRFFDPISQRSSDDVQEAFIRGIESRKLRRIWFESGSANLFDFLPENTLVIILEPEAVSEAASVYSHHHNVEHPGVMTDIELISALKRFQRLEITRLAISNTEFPVFDCGIRSLKRFEVSVDKALNALCELAGKRERVVVCCHNRAEEERLLQLIEEDGGECPVETTVGRISQGFDIPQVGLAVVSDSEIFNRYGSRRRKSRKYAG